MEDHLMRVSLRLFAVLREAAGAEVVAIDLPDDATAADAFAKADLLAPWRERVAFARDDEMIPAASRLKDGDVIDCLPPVSGG